MPHDNPDVLARLEVARAETIEDARTAYAASLARLEGATHNHATARATRARVIGDLGIAPPQTRLDVLEAERAELLARDAHAREAHDLALCVLELERDALDELAEAADVRSLAMRLADALDAAAELRRQAEAADALARERLRVTHDALAALATRRNAEGLPPPVSLPRVEGVFADARALLAASRATYEAAARAWGEPPPALHAAQVARLEVEIARTRASIEIGRASRDEALAAERGAS